MSDNAGLEAYVYVPIERASALKLGLPVRLMNDTGEVLAQTRIDFISPEVDDKTQGVLVKAQVPSDKGFRTEQFVRAQIVLEHRARSHPARHRCDAHQRPGLRVRGRAGRQRRAGCAPASRAAAAAAGADDMLSPASGGRPPDCLWYSRSPTACQSPPRSREATRLQRQAAGRRRRSALRPPRKRLPPSPARGPAACSLQCVACGSYTHPIRPMFVDIFIRRPILSTVCRSSSSSRARSRSRRCRSRVPGTGAARGQRRRRSTPAPTRRRWRAPSPRRSSRPSTASRGCSTCTSTSTNSGRQHDHGDLRHRPQPGPRGRRRAEPRRPAALGRLPDDVRTTASPSRRARPASCWRARLLRRGQPLRLAVHQQLPRRLRPRRAQARARRRPTSSSSASASTRCACGSIRRGWRRAG